MRNMHRSLDDVIGGTGILPVSYISNRLEACSTNVRFVFIVAFLFSYLASGCVSMRIIQIFNHQLSFENLQSDVQAQTLLQFRDPTNPNDFTNAVTQRWDDRQANPGVVWKLAITTPPPGRHSEGVSDQAAISTADTNFDGVPDIVVNTDPTTGVVESVVLATDDFNGDLLPDNNVLVSLPRPTQIISEPKRRISATAEEVKDAIESSFNAWDDIETASINFTFGGFEEVEFAIVAGPNGIADTTADPNSDDVQVVQVGFPQPPDLPLSAGAPVIKPGPDGIFQTIPVGDDLLAPIGHVGFDAKNMITFIDYATPIGLGFPPGVLAVTLPTILEEDTLFLDNPPAGVNSTDLNSDGTPDIPEGLYKAGTLLDVDIFFDRSFVWTIPPFDALTNIPIDPATGLPINLADLISTATHEIGHFIGIAHTPTIDATIFPVANALGLPDSEGRSLEPHDILSASFIYRAEPAFSRDLGFITGTVRRSESAAPVLGAYVFAIDAENGDEVVGTYTNTDGSYILLVPGVDRTVAGVRYSGRYILGIEALDGDPMLPSQANDILADAFNLDIQDGTNDDFAFADEFDNNKRFLIDAKPVATVRAGETVGGINFETDDTFTLGTNDFEAFNFIEGQVLGREGRKLGVHRAKVILRPDPAGQDLDRDGALDTALSPKILRRFIKPFGPYGVPIPDNLGPVISGSIFISQNVELDFGNLFVKIDHPDPTNQLVFILISPSGAQTRITPTGNGMNFFGNEPFFVGKSARGLWTLIVEDFVTSGQGFIFEWGFEISTGDKFVDVITDDIGRFAFRDDRKSPLALVSGEYTLSARHSSLNFPSGSVGAFNSFTGSLSFTTTGGEQPPLAGAGGAPDIRREVFFLAASSPPVISSTLRTQSDSLFTTDEDVPIVLNLTNFGTDVEDKPRKLRWAISPSGDFVGSATEGGPLFTSVEIDKRNILRIIPEPDAFGDAAFTLTLTDTTGASDTADIIVRVVPVPDPPVFISASGQGNSIVTGRGRGKKTLTLAMAEDSRLVLDLFSSVKYITEPMENGNGISDSVTAGDDIQLVPFGFPTLAGQRIIDPGPDNILQSVPGGDDLTTAMLPVNRIIEPFGGGDGFADTQAVGDDIQIVPVGFPAAPGQMIIDPGANNVNETIPLGDDIATTAGVLTVSDPDTSRTDLTMKVTPAQPQCFDAIINGRLNVDGGVFPRLNRFLDIRPADNINVDEIGEKYCRIVVSASDDDGLTFVDFPVNIDIRSVNDPPVLADPGLITTPEGTPVVVDLRGSHLPPEQQTHDVEDSIDKLRFSVSGVDPNLFDIAIDQKTDEMTIIPLKAFGRREITLNVTDRDGATTSRVVTIDITPTANVGPPQFIRATPTGTIFTLPDATLEVPYSQFLSVGGGRQSLTWAIISGSLPLGLSLNSTTGEIFGVPRAASTNVFTVRVADGLADDVQVYQITVDALSSESGFDWAELPSGAMVPPGSATGSGLISANNGSSRTPDIAALPNGDLIVVWSDNSSGNFEIYAARFNADSSDLPNLWSDIGPNSRSGGGISNNIGNSLDPRVVVNNQGMPIVVWSDNSSGQGGSIGDFEIYAKIFDGANWVEIGGASASGGGISNTGGDSTNPAVGIPSSGISAGIPMVVWQEQTSNGPQIYGRQITAGFPEIVSGSASGGGISDTAGNSSDPAIAFTVLGVALVAWSEDSNANGVAPDAEIYLKQSGASGFSEINGSASGEGVSIGTVGDSLNPDLIVDSNNRAFVVWEDLSAGNREIYVREDDNGDFVEVGAGSASGGGISNTAATSRNPTLGLDRNGSLMIAWEEEQPGNPEIYAVTLSGAGVFASLGSEANSGGGISRTNLNSVTPAITTDVTGNPVCVWSEGPLGGPFNIFAKFLPTDDAVMTSGDSFSGAINYIEDIDAVDFSVVAKTGFSAEIRPLTRPNLPETLVPEASLISPDGTVKVFNAQKGVIKISKFLLPDDGTYRLTIAAAHGASPASSIGAYRLDKFKLTGPKVSRKIVGDINPAGEVDSFSQNIAAGSRVRIIAKGGKKKSAGLDPVLRLLDPTGVEIASNDDVRPGKKDALISIPNGTVLTKSGTYFIVISGFGSSTGDYRLTLKISSTKGERNDLVE